MGEIADDMIDGTSCSACGQYFVDGNDNLYTHGYPVICWDCWNTLTKEEKKLNRKASKPTL